MSGDGKGGDGHRPPPTAPIFDSTVSDVALLRRSFGVGPKANFGEQAIAHPCRGPANYLTSGDEPTTLFLVSRAQCAQSPAMLVHCRQLLRCAGNDAP